MSAAPPGGRNGTAARNRRLAQIRRDYAEFKDRQSKSEWEQLEDIKAAGEEMFEGMRRRGVDEATIARCREDAAVADAAMLAGIPEEDHSKEIRRGTFSEEVLRCLGVDLPASARDSVSIGGDSFTMRTITVTSEGSRHWRAATIKDFPCPVYVHSASDICPFGVFEKVHEIEDEDGTRHLAASVQYLNRSRHRFYEFGGKFEDVSVIPREVLTGVKDEAPPGRLFSGGSVRDGSGRWSPAPKGKAWIEHPFLRNPNGTYLPHEHAFYTQKTIACSGIVTPRVVDRAPRKEWEKSWREYGALQYWCPVLKRFLSEGERLRQRHWFHDGDGSANRRYFYDQYEMIDMHGGLDCVPKSIGDSDEEVCCVGVAGYEDVVAERVWNAYKKGEVIDIDDDDRKMPAKKRRL
ncbi:hypothetical protein ACHAWF_003256 [Thalassiosira exigua]